MFLHIACDTFLMCAIFFDLSPQPSRMRPPSQLSTGLTPGLQGLRTFSTTRGSLNQWVLSLQFTVLCVYNCTIPKAFSLEKAQCLFLFSFLTPIPLSHTHACMCARTHTHTHTHTRTSAPTWVWVVGEEVQGSQRANH